MGIKIGIGIYPHLLTRENFKFIRQAGATHVVAHLPGWARRVGRGLPPEAMWVGWPETPGGGADEDCERRCLMRDPF